MYLGSFNLKPTGNYRQVELPEHALCVLCLERKPHFLGVYRHPTVRMFHTRRLCWVCLNRSFLKAGQTMPTGGGAA